MLDIIAAIESKLRIEFFYKKKKKIIEPYIIGLNSKGEVLIRGYEVSPLNSGLKLFKLAEMEGIKVTTIKFLFTHPCFRAKDSQIIKTMAVVIY